MWMSLRLVRSTPDFCSCYRWSTCHWWWIHPWSFPLLQARKLFRFTLSQEYWGNRSSVRSGSWRRWTPRGTLLFWKASFWLISITVPSLRGLSWIWPKGLWLAWTCWIVRSFRITRNSIRYAFIILNIRLNLISPFYFITDCCHYQI